MTEQVQHFGNMWMTYIGFAFIVGMLVYEVVKSRPKGHHEEELREKVKVASKSRRA